MGTKENRMWVVVSRDVFNRDSRHVLACPLTSYPPTVLDIEVKDTPHNPLSHASAMLPRMISPILKSELGPAQGRLPSKVVAQVVDRIRMIVEVL